VGKEQYGPGSGGQGQFAFGPAGHEYYVQVNHEEPAFFGHRPTCWRPWPEGWEGCPSIEEDPADSPDDANEETQDQAPRPPSLGEQPVTPDESDLNVRPLQPQPAPEESVEGQPRITVSEPVEHKPEKLEVLEPFDPPPTPEVEDVAPPETDDVGEEEKKEETSPPAPEEKEKEAPAAERKEEEKADVLVDPFSPPTAEDAPNESAPPMAEDEGIGAGEPESQPKEAFPPFPEMNEDAQPVEEKAVEPATPDDLFAPPESSQAPAGSDATPRLVTKAELKGSLANVAPKTPEPDPAKAASPPRKPTLWLTVKDEPQPASPPARTVHRKPSLLMTIKDDPKAAEPLVTKDQLKSSRTEVVLGGPAPAPAAPMIVDNTTPPAAPVVSKSDLKGQTHSVITKRLRSPSPESKTSAPEATPVSTPARVISKEELKRSAMAPGADEQPVLKLCAGKKPGAAAEDESASEPRSSGRVIYRLKSKTDTSSPARQIGDVEPMSEKVKRFYQ